MKTDSDKIIAEKILQFADLDNKQVLEIGCGNGRITSLITDKPKKLTAIDPDVYSIRQAKKKIIGADFQIGSGENLKFSDNSFDLVIFTLSLHHQNSKNAIREVCRVVKDTGYILVIEPVNNGEVEQVFALLHNEDQATLEAQKAMKESDLKLERSEIFNAKWIFENKQDLYQSLFNYYDMAFDHDIAVQIEDKLGPKLNMQPIVLIDTMVIQLFRN